MQCWKCGLELIDLPQGKMSFREICDKCFSWQHCCRNCKNYKPGMPNDCLIPGTESIADRESSNFCEEFQVLGQMASRSPDLKAIEKKIFGSGDDHSSKSKDKSKAKFDDLFRD